MRERRTLIVLGLAVAALIGAIAITDPRGSAHAWPVAVDWAGIVIIVAMALLLLLPPG